MDWNGGDQDGYFYEANDVPKFYASYGFSLPATDQTDAEVIYYWGYHGAVRRYWGCGAGRWIMFESKIGNSEKIEHVWNQLNGSAYGEPVLFYKQP
jgi:hypothetical protein